MFLYRGIFMRLTNKKKWISGEIILRLRHFEEIFSEEISLPLLMMWSRLQQSKHKIVCCKSEGVRPIGVPTNQFDWLVDADLQSTVHSVPWFDCSPSEIHKYPIIGLILVWILSNCAVRCCSLQINNNYKTIDPYKLTFQ